MATLEQPQETRVEETHGSEERETLRTQLDELAVQADLARMELRDAAAEAAHEAESRWMKVRRPLRRLPGASREAAEALVDGFKEAVQAVGHGFSDAYDRFRKAM